MIINGVVFFIRDGTGDYRVLMGIQVLWDAMLCQLVNTGLFISSSGISEIDCATTKTDTAERSISMGRESLQVFFFKF